MTMSMSIFNIDHFSSNPNEIDQSIKWLSDIKDDCEVKINRLQQLKSQRERSVNHRAAIKSLAMDFAEPDFLELERIEQADVIRERLKCSYEQSYALIPVVITHAKRKKAKLRNIRIAKLHDAGFSPSAIADDEQVDVSKVTIHKVINQHKEKPFY